MESGEKGVVWKGILVDVNVVGGSGMGWGDEVG